MIEPLGGPRSDDPKRKKQLAVRARAVLGAFAAKRGEANRSLDGLLFLRPGEGEGFG